MSSTTSLTHASAPAPENSRRWLRNPTVVVGLAVIAFWVIGTIIAPLVLAYDPLQQNISDRMAAPALSHVFGADELGRDIFARVMYGARITLPAGLIGVLASLVIGTTVGAVAAYF